MSFALTSLRRAAPQPPAFRTSVDALRLAESNELPRPRLCRESCLAGVLLLCSSWRSGRLCPNSRSWRRWRTYSRRVQRLVRCADWRDFRAKLAMQDQKANGDAKDSDVGWAHASPILESGSVLLAKPSDHFALEGQHLLKSIVFIIEHSNAGDVGLILNRPTELTTLDLGIPRPSWKLRFGGAPECLRSDLQRSIKPLCIHSLERLAGTSTEVIPGVFVLGFEEARSAVEAEVADVGDFVTFVGTCEWKAGELQRELESGEAWTLAATSKDVLYECLLPYHNMAEFAGPQSELDDGTGNWTYLNSMLGPECIQREAAALEAYGGKLDDLLIRWITRNLFQPLAYDRDVRSLEALTMGSPDDRVSFDRLRVGAVLYANASCWLLGMPWGSASSEAWRFNMARLGPCQYIHRGVFLLVGGGHVSNEPSVLVLLNGPSLPKEAGKVFFGGPADDDGTFRTLGSTVRSLGAVGREQNLAGCTVLEPGLLECLVECGALCVAEEHIKAEDLLEDPCEMRWELAGGSISTIPDIRAAALGDEQRQRWFKRFLNLDLEGQWS